MPARRQRSLAPSVSRRRGRRFLALAVAATLAVVALDLTGWGWTGRLHSAGAAAFGPVLRWVGPNHDDALSRARADNLALTEQLRQARETDVASTQLASLLASPSLAGARVIAARVVSVGGLGGFGPQRVTIDVGSKDGIQADQPVVSASGLVGRVVDVSTWTSDVLVVGAADLRVGVRAGTDGVLGMVGAPAGPGPRSAGELTLTVVSGGSVTPGQNLTTLGSPSGRPFVAGIPVGTVTRLDEPDGAQAQTAAVVPAVTVSGLDVVGVLLSEPRSAPRPATTP